ncbi:MAG: hypothetical protein SF123_18870 [Chloroflexota bacterium]|nr:hypothetical protein [Chloroflexota bacterium]
MVTWQLWRHLRHPNTVHALFRRFSQPVSPTAAPIPMLRKVLIGAIGLVLLGVYIAPRINSFPMAWLISVEQLAILGYMIYSSIQISIGVANEINDNTATNDDALLYLTPVGAVGILWVIAAGFVHRNEWLSSHLGALRRLFVLMFVLIGLHMLDALRYALWIDTLATERTVMDIIAWLILGGTLWLAQYQVITIAALIGIVARGYVRRSVVFWTAVIHAAVIGFIFICWGLLLPTFTTPLELRLGFNAEWMLLTPLLLVIQELVVALLWQNARSRLSDEPNASIEALLSL